MKWKFIFVILAVLLSVCMAKPSAESVSQYKSKSKLFQTKLENAKKWSPPKEWDQIENIDKSPTPVIRSLIIDLPDHLSRTAGLRRENYDSSEGLGVPFAPEFFK